MDGIVNVMKPAGMTSHDVVAKLRRVYHTKKVGHTGTLDPDAIGVLPICVGQATRLVEYFTEKDKTYKVIMKFGNETTTQDSSGEVTITTELPTLSKAEFCAVTEQFIGEIQQVPPMYSAIKKDGQPLYKLAREGVEVRFMYDGTCSLSLLPPHYGKRLERKGIQCRVFAPLRPFLSTHQNNRDHRKIVVIDGHTAFTGGVNLADEYINEKHPFGKWKDSAVRIEGSAVNNFTVLFTCLAWIYHCNALAFYSNSAVFNNGFTVTGNQIISF